MTKEQFDNLKRGDIVVGKSGNSYVILETTNHYPTAVRTVTLSNSDEWELYSKKEQTQQYNYKVILKYFKPSGKYYSSDWYISHKQEMYQIFEEVKMKFANMAVDYHILIDVPDHPNNHPALIIPEK